MKPELENKLFEKYPKIFIQRTLNMRQTAMCFGCECGSGWYDLIDKLCNDIQTYLDAHPDVQQVEAVQVKEKFGGLRYYVDGGDNNTDLLIDIAERESYYVCENCGTRENIGRTDGWITTICKKCFDEWQLERPDIKRNWAPITPRKAAYGNDSFD